MINSHAFRRRTLLQGAGALCAGVALSSRAQGTSFPKGLVRLVLPLPAGGVADSSARPIAAELARMWDQSVIVDNRPGGLFMIGMQAVLQAPPDGCTILHLYNSMASVQAVHKKFDIARQLTPLTEVSSVPMVLLVPGKSRFESVAELVAFGRSNPGKLNYCSLGEGSVEHLKSVQFERAAGFTATNVPFKSGPEMLNSLIAGILDFSLTAGSFAHAFAPKGQVRVLAVVDEKRWSDMPEVPTIAEAGVQLPPLTLWNGFAVRAETPVPIVDRLFKDLTVAATATKVREAIQPLGFSPTVSTSPQDFKEMVAKDVAWMSGIAQDLNIPQKK